MYAIARVGSLYDANRDWVLAKIAADLEQALAHRTRSGGAGGLTNRLLACGDGWVVDDIICTCGPQDHSFEEQHAAVSIAIVIAGTFQYAADASGGPRSELMTPGSVLLGNPGQYFECEHTHDAGDRCISFRYAADVYARIAADAGADDSTLPFRLLRLPPSRALSPLIGRSCAGLVGSMTTSWEEISVQVAAQAAATAGRLTEHGADVTREDLARVTAIVRMIERQADGSLTLAALARSAEMGVYRFLRTFSRVTGVTPHQYLLRARLREAATRLAVDPSKVLDIAFDCGFGDVSNFNRAFRAEFGVAPRRWKEGS